MGHEVGWMGERARPRQGSVWAGPEVQVGWDAPSSCSEYTAYARSCTVMQGVRNDAGCVTYRGRGVGARATRHSETNRVMKGW